MHETTAAELMQLNLIVRYVPPQQLKNIIKSYLQSPDELSQKKRFVSLLGMCLRDRRFGCFGLFFLIVVSHPNPSRATANPGKHSFEAFLRRKFFEIYFLKWRILVYFKI